MARTVSQFNDVNSLTVPAAIPATLQENKFLLTIWISNSNASALTQHLNAHEILVLKHYHGTA